MAIQAELLEKYRENEHLVTKVKFDFTEEVTGTVIVNIYHYRPTTKAQVKQNVIQRGLTEQSILLAQKSIDELLPNIDI
jgi:hypothetical protein